MVYTVIAVDYYNGIIVPYNGSVARFPNLFQRGVKNILLQFLRPPTSQLNGSYTVLTQSDLGAFTPRLTISSQATGTDGDEDTYVLTKLREENFTWNGTLGGFTAALSCNTTQVRDRLNGAAYTTAMVEISSTLEGNLSPIYESDPDEFRIRASIDEGSDAPINIINGVARIFGPVEIQFASGNVYAVTETAPGTVVFDLEV